MADKQVTEVVETAEQEPDTNVRRERVVRRADTSAAVVFQRVVWYVAGVIIALLALRLVLQLLGANEDAGFVEFIYGLSGIFAAPFFGMFNYQPTYGQSYLEVGTIVAIIVYALLAWGIAKLATLNRPHEEV